MSEISEVTKELAKTFKKEIDKVKIDPKSGLAKLPADLYATTLPEGLTAELVEQVHAHNTVVAGALLLATSELAVPFAKKHKDLPHVQVILPETGKNTFGVDWQREKQVINPRTKESSTKYGSTAVKLDFYGIGTHGDIAKIKAQATAAAASLAD